MSRLRPPIACREYPLTVGQTRSAVPLRHETTPHAPSPSRPLSWDQSTYSRTGRSWIGADHSPPHHDYRADVPSERRARRRAATSQHVTRPKPEIAKAPLSSRRYCRAEVGLAPPFDRDGIAPHPTSGRRGRRERGADRPGKDSSKRVAVMPGDAYPRWSAQHVCDRR